MGLNSAAAHPYGASVASHGRTQDLPAQAHELLRHAEAAVGLECGPNWFENLQRSVFPGDATVRYYVASKSGRVVAVLPLRHSQGRLSRTVEALGNYYTALYAPAITEDCSAQDLGALLARATADGHAQRIRLEPLDPDSRGFTLLERALREIGWVPHVEPRFGNWFLPVVGGWADYLAQRSGILRSTLRRKGRKFAAAGGHFEVVCEPERLAAAIADFNSVYARSWKSQEPYPDFVPGLANWLARDGHMRLGLARMGNQTIAAQIWMVAGGKASIFKLAHDQAMTQGAPGTLLTAHLMRYVIEHDRVKEVDFLMGDEPYKRLWMSQRRQRVELQAFNPRSARGLLLLLRHKLRSLSPRARPTGKSAHY